MRSTKSVQPEIFQLHFMKKKTTYLTYCSRTVHLLLHLSQSRIKCHISTINIMLLLQSVVTARHNMICKITNITAKKGNHAVKLQTSLDMIILKRYLQSSVKPWFYSLKLSSSIHWLILTNTILCCTQTDSITSKQYLVLKTPSKPSIPVIKRIF